MPAGDQKIMTIKQTTIGIIALLLAVFTASGASFPVSFDAPWQFTNGPEFPGATGSFTADKNMLRNDMPTGLLDADFTGGGNYVGIRRNADKGFDRLSLDVMTATRKLGVLVTDIDGQWFYFELPLSGNGEAWQPVKLDFADAGLKSTAHGGGKNDGIIRFPLRGLLFRVGTAKDLMKFTVRFGNLQLEDSKAIPVAKAEVPGGLFLETESPQFRLDAPVPGLRYEVRNWKGERVEGGVWPENSAAPLPLPRLQPGRYMLSFSSPGGKAPESCDFSILGDFRFPVSGNCSYALDVASECIPSVGKCGRNHEDGVRFFADLARRTGIRMVRDRFNWAVWQPVGGEVPRLDFFTAMQNLFADNGLASCVTFHTAPRWARENDQAKLPSDPVAVYRFLETMSRKYGRQVIWEFWNEQMLSCFSIEPAWEFATMMKAAGLGAKAGAPENPLLPGAFCPPFENDYNRTIMANGVAAYFDIFNIHCYEPLQKYPELVGGARKLLKDYGVGAMPVWVTENGTRAEGPGKQRDQNRKEHSAGQEMIQAEFAVKSQVLMQSLGIARTFTFVLPPYNEGDGVKVWGLVRFDYTAKPGLAALGTLIRQLGAAQYLGEAELPEGIRGFLYRQPDGSQSMVYWSNSELDTEDDSRFGIEPDNLHPRKFELSAKAPVQTADLFGTPGTLKPDRGILRLEATRYPAYLGNLDELKMKRQPEPEPNAQPSPCEKAVVLQFRYPHGETFDIDSFARDRLIVNRPPHDETLTLTVWNLGNTVEKGTLEISDRKIAGFPAELEIPPFESRQIAFSLPDSADALYSELTVGGRFNGRPISPLVVPLLRRDLLVPDSATPLPFAADPANWQKNSSGEMNISPGETGNAVRFDTTFQPGIDRWVYPALSLPEGISLKNAISLEFEIKSQQGAHTHVVMFPDSTADAASNRYITYQLKPGDWQKCTVRLPPGTENGRLIRIGMNPDTLSASYQLRNLSLHYGKFKGEPAR